MSIYVAIFCREQSKIGGEYNYNCQERSTNFQINNNLKIVDADGSF